MSKLKINERISKCINEQIINTNYLGMIEGIHLTHRFCIQFANLLIC